MTPFANWWWYGPDDAAAAAAAVAAAIASVAAMSSAGGGGGGCGGGITILRSGFIRSRTRATMTRPIPAHQMVDHPKRPIFFFFLVEVVVVVERREVGVEKKMNKRWKKTTSIASSVKTKGPRPVFS